MIIMFHYWKNINNMRNKKGQFVKGFTTESKQKTGILVDCNNCNNKFYVQPQLRFAIDNGLTLCIKCHKLTDNYGKK